MFAALSQLKHKARDTARSALWLTMGAVFMLIALAFLTAALWLLVAQDQGALIATTVIGALYFVVAVIAFLLGLRGHRSMPEPPDAKDDDRRQPLVQIAEGFAVGMQAGRAARSERR
jgi:protein-S-isoprenylcysteine O-methyltransferase Ste14